MQKIELSTASNPLSHYAEELSQETTILTLNGKAIALPKKRSHGTIESNKKVGEQQKMAVQRWTDEMLDELASSVNELTSSVSEVKESVSEVNESISEVKDSIDGLRITAQALLQVAAQHQRDMELVKEEIELAKTEIELAKTEIELGKQRQAESDERFNVLLEEIRYLIRRNEGE